MKLLTLVFVIKVLINLTSSEFFASTEKLRDLYNIEDEIMKDFLSILERFHEVHSQLYENITPWYDDHETAAKNVDKYITNPLNAFLMIKRNVYDLKSVLEVLTSFMDVVNEKIESLEKKSVLKAEEVAGVIAGIMRLQKTYQLKSEDLVEGIIDGEQTRTPLTPNDIYVLAYESASIYDENFYSQSYFKIVAERMKAGAQLNNALTYDQVEELISDFEKEKVQRSSEEIVEDSYEIKKEVTHRVCRGTDQRSPHETKDLKCRFLSSTPFSRLAPFKLEEASIEPYIILYHEIISNNEIDVLMNLSLPLQAKAEVYTNETYEDTSFRLGELSWLYDGEHEILDRLNDRFEDMTGLAMETAEGLQVQNYGIGGHFNLHSDATLHRSDPSADERIATLLIYLSNVEKGGATAFSFLKFRVEPIKGSAVFWYNLKYSGYTEPLTQHAGCPVLLGSKWVANKWIHNIGQEFRRKCKPGDFEESDDKLEMSMN